VVSYAQPMDWSVTRVSLGRGLGMRFASISIARRLRSAARESHGNCQAAKLSAVCKSIERCSCSPTLILPGL